MNNNELPFDADFAINLDKLAQEAKEAQGLEVTEIIENTKDRLTISIDKKVGEGFRLDFRRQSPSEIDIYTTDPNSSGMIQVYTGKSDEGAWWEYDFILETIAAPLKIFGNDEPEKSKEEIKAEIQEEIDENGRYEREGVSKKWRDAASAFVHDGYEVSTTHRDDGYDVRVEPPSDSDTQARSAEGRDIPLEAVGEPVTDEAFSDEEIRGLAQTLADKEMLDKPAVVVDGQGLFPLDGTRVEIQQRLEEEYFPRANRQSKPFAIQYKNSFRDETLTFAAVSGDDFTVLVSIMADLGIADTRVIFNERPLTVARFEGEGRLFKPY